MSPLLWLCCDPPVGQGCTNRCMLLERQGRADAPQSCVVCPLLESSSHNQVDLWDASAVCSIDPGKQVRVYYLAPKRTSQVLRTFDNRIFPPCTAQTGNYPCFPVPLNVRIIHSKLKTDISYLIFCEAEPLDFSKRGRRRSGRSWQQCCIFMKGPSGGVCLFITGERKGVDLSCFRRQH